ncbi:MAG: divalent-cation tolerance protein CutA [Holosporaceae bacterium]|jgi:periplasmic divalent cation tolerance protein|nr:divalent-cation tolerance protein CutA [Holosporaceae bacterium]
MNTGYAVVLSTIDSERKAEILAKKILRKKLAACVQIQKIKSFYRWKGQTEHAEEYLLMIKTAADLFSQLSEFIRQNHSYETPEIVQIPITEASKEYLDWMADEIQPLKTLKFDPRE